MAGGQTQKGGWGWIKGGRQERTWKLADSLDFIPRVMGDHGKL